MTKIDAGQGKFLRLYQEKVDVMIKGMNLITVPSNQPRQEAAGSLTEQLKFRYDFVRRYHANQEAIQKWEESASIPEDHRLGLLVVKGWKKYCREIVSKLHQKLDFIKIALNFPSSVSSKESGAVYLRSVSQDIEDAISCINQIVDHEELKSNLEQANSFGESVNESFNGLLQKNAEELLTFCRESVEKDNLCKRFQFFFFCFFIVHLPQVSARIDQRLTDSLIENFTCYLEDLNESEILDGAQQALSDLKVDYTEDATKPFVSLIFDSLAVKAGQSKDDRQADHYRSIVKFVQSSDFDISSDDLNRIYQDLRIRCSSLLPFRVYLRKKATQNEDAGVAQASPSAKLSGTKVDFEGFSLKEFLSQSLPN